MQLRFGAVVALTDRLPCLEEVDTTCVGFQFFLNQTVSSTMVQVQVYGTIFLRTTVVYGRDDPASPMYASRPRIRSASRLIHCLFEYRSLAFTPQSIACHLKFWVASIFEKDVHFQRGAHGLSQGQAFMDASQLLCRKMKFVFRTAEFEANHAA
jgi:hypothetical protein